MNPQSRFRSVGEKDFVVRDVDSAIAIIVLRDLFAQKFVALLVPVTAKRFADAEFIDRA